MHGELHELLERAVGEPPRHVTVQAVRRRVVRRRVALASTAGAAALIVAAGAVLAVSVPRTGSALRQSRPAGISVAELAYRTSAAAAVQPGIRPGQWVYRKEWLADRSPGRRFAGVVRTAWTTPDDQQTVTVSGGKVHYSGGFLELPPVVIFKAGQRGFIPPVSYSALDSLPRSPQALDRYLGRLRYGPGLQAPERAFATIGFMLAAYAMPPALTAELYRALGDIPGVRADDHARDVAGRPGVAFSLGPFALAPWQGLREEIVVSPRTYRLTGVDLLQPNGQLYFGTAILQEAYVPRPGLQP